MSAAEFQATNFLERLFATLDETGLDPKFVRAGADRKRLDEAGQSAAAVLRILRRRGVGVTVYIGTGYSSLNYLRKTSRRCA